MRTFVRSGGRARLALSTVSFLALGWVGSMAPPALAQTVPAAEPESGRDIVVITAQKREQDIQDVPISVSAVGADKLETQGIGNLEDLSGYVPGVQIGKGAIYTPINIRGIGSGSNRGFEQSVGMYVDGVYLGRDRQFRAPFMDLERVEVLRGPQGILFGKNTIAGAISVITAEPDLGGVSGSASLRWEPDTNTHEAMGAYSTPLTDSLAVRVAGKYRTSDGYLTNATRRTEEPDVEEAAVRASILWEPTDALTAVLKYSYLDSTVMGSNSVATRFTRVTGTVVPPSPLANLVFNNVPVVEPQFSLRDHYTTFRDNPVVAGWSEREAQIRTQSNLAVLNVDYALNDDLTVTSVTGLSTYKTKDGIDVDFLPLRFLFRNEQQAFEQLSEELRIAFDDAGPIDFIGGMYVETQDLSQDGALLINSRLGFLPASVFAGGPTAAVYPILPLNVMARNSHFDQHVDTRAIFGEVTWNVTDEVRVALGARYSEEDKDFLKQTWFGADASPQGLYAPPASVLQENVLLLFVKALDPNNNLNNARASTNESGFDPSIKLQWDVATDVMAFVTYSEGRKSGGFNGNDDQVLSVNVLPYTALTPAGLSTRNPAYDPTALGSGFQYRPETAKSFEVGAKSRLFDGRMTLNGSAFVTDYSDLQVTQFQGTGFVVANAQGAKIKGFEIESSLEVNDELRLSGSVAYLDFAFSDYRNSGCTAQQVSERTAPCTQDLTGRPNAFAPEWSGNLAIDWLHPISDSLEFRATADVNYRGEHYLDYDLDPATLQDGQARINLRFGLGDISGAWEIAAFGKNLTDEVTYTSVNDIPLAPGAFTGFVQEPRTYGFEARARY